tara:strand:- start:1266 stop:1871 length:606 start_codon:yes stop_codon:yes gene_type:complete
MFYLIKIIMMMLLLFTYSCNKNMTDEEKKEMWSKAQTTGAIIERSGTKFNSGINKELALRDAATRLQSGGGLFKDGLSLNNITGGGKQKQDSVGTYSMPINKFLWQGALNTVNFMPLTSADPMGGTILTDWYSTTSNENERCKLNIFISGSELKTQNLKVTSFCQDFKNQKWVNKTTDPDNNIKIENAILNNAKKLRLQSS